MRVTSYSQTSRPMSQHGEAAARSAHIHYVRTPVDAAAPPQYLMRSPSLVTSPLAPFDTIQHLRNRSTFGLFFLAFHHLPDDVARQVLRAALDPTTGSGGFAIFELQGRTFSEILMVLAIAPLLLLIAPFYFGTIRCCCYSHT